MPRRWRWISGVIPVAYPPPGIWQGRNGKWLGQKSQASKTSLPTLQFVGSMCLFSWVCRNKLLGTYLNLHATHMIHYQARCALTRQKVKIDRDGKEVTLRPKHLVLATGLPLGCGKASALEILKDWGHQGPKLCFLDLVFVASCKWFSQKTLFMELRVPSLSCSFTTAFIVIWSLLSFCKRIFIILVAAWGMAILQSLSWKIPLLSKVRCSIPPSTRMGRSTKVGGKGSPVGGIQKHSGWRWPPFLIHWFLPNFENHHQKNLSSCDGFHCDKVVFQWECFGKKKTSCKTCLFSHHTRQKGRGRWLQHLGAWNLSQRLGFQHKNRVGIFRWTKKKASYPIDIGETVRPGNAECWVLWCKLGG